MPSIHSVLASAISFYTRSQIFHPFILSYPVSSLYSRGTRFVIHSFCLIQCHRSYMYMWRPTCHSFIHAAPDMPFIHSVLSSAIVHTRGTRHAIQSFCLSQCNPFLYAAPDMPSLHSVLSSAIPLFTRHQICHLFILSYLVPSFIHVAPDMSSIHSVLASVIPLYTYSSTRHAIHSFFH
jgi:hypothetical protein